MNADDRIRLQHMLDAAREAIGFATGKTRSSLDSDRGLILILVQLISIVGEAATNVSEQTRAASPEIPWQLIKGMRNRLIHGYFDINLDIVWNTTQNRLPELIAQLEALLDHNEEESP
jgi:uncharacterized protein with HEPN domain